MNIGANKKKNRQKEKKTYKRKKKTEGQRDRVIDINRVKIRHSVINR